VDVERLIDEASVVYWKVREADASGIGALMEMDLPQVHRVNGGRDVGSS
jgi:hypothetical protein